MEIFPPSFSFLFLRSCSFVFLLPGGFSVFSVTARITTAFVLAFSSSHTVLGVESPESSLAGFSYGMEFLVGAAIALPFSLGIKGVFMFGALLEQGRGQNLGASYGASVEQEGEGQLGKLLEFGVLAALMSSGLLLHLVTLLHESLVLFPPGTLMFSSGLELFAPKALSFCFSVVAFSMTLFVPIGMLFIICDLSVGFVAKLVPGLPVFAEMFVVKSLVCFLLLLWVIVPTLSELPLELYGEATNLVESLFLSLRT